MLVKIMIDCARMLSSDYKMLGSTCPTPPPLTQSTLYGSQKISGYWKIHFWYCTVHSGILISRTIFHNLYRGQSLQKVLVWILPQHHLYSICVCDPSICLHMRRNHIIAQCLCSCLSLANLHLPSSAQEATFWCLLPCGFNIFCCFCYIVIYFLLSQAGI